MVRFSWGKVPCCQHQEARRRHGGRRLEQGDGVSGRKGASPARPSAPRAPVHAARSRPAAPRLSIARSSRDLGSAAFHHIKYIFVDALTLLKKKKQDFKWEKVACRLCLGGVYGE